MTSIDELFKTPSLPSGQKRKFEPVRDPNEIYKSAKLDTNGAASGSRAATVDDAEDEDIAGPELPPDFGQEDVPDDEEGRFFGGGVTRDTTNALDFIEQQEKEGVRAGKIDSAWLKRTALNFEKRISKNAELRAKYESDPQKFMASEADLDVDIKGLSILSEHPQLYPEFAELGCVGSLVSLLAHENTDIAIDVIEILAELTDEDVEAESEQWESLVDAMLDADLIELLAQNLSRLDEDIESDRAGVYHILNVLENLSSQSSLLSVYRKRDPEKDSDEEEYVENLFDSLTCVIIDVILAWLVAEDDGAKARINSLLSEQDQDLSIIRATLEEQLSGLEGPEGEEEEKDMLTTLLEFI
ncbi:hypothetical protein CISG_06586 [Coccidioides immitis RMSCC 3703]|uniref:Beta-catenin-like protein 1 N-terminal domain-containing protein n=1 Tax=Coccidioides immitis RMSCC 3703 TaxID=454286 RepID=A0A0J8R1Y5_COCIT|nr:hypothetical protein CISG_06586 [Coccidioides immitis RMSCC 3703]